MQVGIYIVLLALVPFGCWCFNIADDYRPFERHGRSVSVYHLPQGSLLAVIVLMAVVCVTGIALTCMSEAGAISALPANVSLYFLLLELVLLFAYAMLRRYSVRTYSDHMLVTPLFGETKYIRYADVTGVERDAASGYDSLDRVAIYVDGRRAATIDSSFDLPRILAEMGRAA